MAKSIDTSKIERIKEATIELVVSHGYYAASVSQIAKRAGVADGYLYRFYPGKYDLVADIFKNKVEALVDLINTLIDKESSVKEVVYEFISYIIQRAKEAPNQTKFLFMLIHDYNFEIGKDVAEKMKAAFHKLLIKGQVGNEIKRDITSEDLYILIIGQTLLFIDSRYRNHFGHANFDGEMVDRLATFCLKALN